MDNARRSRNHHAVGCCMQKLSSGICRLKNLYRSKRHELMYRGVVTTPLYADSNPCATARDIASFTEASSRVTQQDAKYIEESVCAQLTSVRPANSKLVHLLHCSVASLELKPWQTTFELRQGRETPQIGRIRQIQHWIPQALTLMAQWPSALAPRGLASLWSLDVPVDRYRRRIRMKRLC